MTQLAGVICENRSQIVLVSDRMVSQADNTLTFEHEPKYEYVCANALVLTAGSIHEPEILEDVRAELKGQSSVREIANEIASHFRRVRKKRVEMEILDQFGIASFDEFYEKQRLFHEDTNLKLLDAIENYSLDVELMLGGVENGKGHLYRIGDPGTYMSYDQLGYLCIGIGNRHAEPVFAFFRYKPTLSVSQALQIAFEAKKRAEMAGGVGRLTDAWIIDKEGCHAIKQETIDQLENFHRTQEGFAQFRTSLDIKKEKITC